MGEAERPICSNCGALLILALPPGGNGPRTFQCLDCDRPDPVNTPPPKGGGFGLRLEAGLIDPSGRFDQTTLKLSSGSSGF
jgi:hypothetical protein